MTAQSVISLLRQHRAQVRRRGVKSLSIFGSVARGEEREDSDVDILVEFDGPVTFDAFMDTKFYLEDLLGRKVDPHVKWRKIAGFRDIVAHNISA